MTKKQVKQARADSISAVSEGDHVRTVELQAFAEARGYGTLDDVWDEEGDGIYACHRNAFMAEGYPAVRTVFSQGTDPRLVARVLRKMAAMLEGAKGRELVHLGLIYNDLDYARRFPDGEVLIGNHVKEYQEYLRRRERGVEDDEDRKESE